MTLCLENNRELIQRLKQDRNLALGSFIKYHLGMFLPEVPCGFGVQEMVRVKSRASF